MIGGYGIVTTLVLQQGIGRYVFIKEEAMIYGFSVVGVIRSNR